MAELIGGAFLSASLQVTLDRLASRDIKDYFHGRKLKDEMLKKLDIALNSISQVLEDAEERQYKSPNVMKWLNELKEAIYEAELLLDEVATEVSRQKLEAEFQPATSKVRGFLTAFINPFHKEVASRVEEVLENIKFLAEQKDMIGLRNGTFAGNEVGASWKLSNRLPTTSLVDESRICGREGDKEEIIKILLSDNITCNQVPLISIVGMGGMGKTTLAQLVYNDQRILDQFDLKAWVYVSQDFGVVAVTTAILKALQSLASEEKDLNLLQLELKKRLTGKKFLLVLDDVWNENYLSWEVLQIPFIYGSSGSRILVTTRSKKVASVMNSSQLLHLRPLEKEDCWKLFANYAFHDKDAIKYPNLVSVGSRIVDKCGGLPLAIKTLGNILRVKFSQHEWVKILESDMWHLSDNDSSINPALRLSYHNLPSYLKRCFAYCSIFPKGYEFDRDQLIQLWMAEGLLNCCQINKSEEELGSEFFNDLVARSFFQQSRCQVSRFTMHDLLNDLAKSVSGDFCLQVEGNLVQDIPKRTRHISCSDNVHLNDKFLDHICKCNRLRCLMVLKMEPDSGDLMMNGNVQRGLFSRIKYLRVLSFNNCLLTELVDDISNLKLLRYLDLSYCKIKRLPDSICMLHNLQTLLLIWCYLLTELPLDLHKLVNLRHLDVRMSGIKKMPKHIGRLKHLQTLSCFSIEKHCGFDVKELGNLNHLQGTLSILKLENVTDPMDAMEANMKDKKHLEGLVLDWGDKFGRSNENDDSIIERGVLEALQPNGNLKKLTVLHYDGTSFPSWFGGSHLPNLVSIMLTGSKFCFILPPFGQLPSLKELSISCYYRIEVIGPEFCGNDSSNIPFRSLEILKFEEMSAWKEWCSFEGEGLSCLKELSIKRCPWLRRALPQHLPSLQKLVICECQQLENSVPKAASIHELQLRRCEKILLKDLPSSLTKAKIYGTRVIDSCLEQILLNSASLEELEIQDFHGPNLKWSSLDLHRHDSLGTLSITSWYSSSLPFALDLFANLHSLHFYDCPQLESFPKGGLPSSLCRLEIEGCPKLVASREEWGLFKLHSLKELRISDDFENVVSFPEERLLPPALSDLYLTSCLKLTTTNSMGFLHLKSLKSFYVLCCPRLQCLPEEGLPNSLSVLCIHCCPLLQQRYQKDGEHWHKIHHIPSVNITT
ncbi:putative disease resistance RPP13-like protein 1, partial [Mucuna pruriens]